MEKNSRPVKTENLHTSSDNISELAETNLDPFAVELWNLDV
jgi:hypothetical protein